MKPFAVCIAGPTATGKTEAAVALCQALDGEVISMDSMQIYQGLDIGTAKPTPGEMGGVPHRLLSFVPADAAYSAAEYQRDALAAMDEALSRGKLPVFCGGTGLYLAAVTRPLGFGGAVGGGELRQRLMAWAEKPGGPEQLHARLQAVDPEAAARLDPRNIRRVVRALEVYELTGLPLSSRSAEWTGKTERDFLIFALTWPRETLYRRIEARVDRMLSAGLVGEVQGLLDGGVPRGCQAMRAIGYKEAAALLAGEMTREEMAEAIKGASRRYAKRQLTWLRRDERVRWLDASAFDGPEALHGEMIRQINEAREDKR